MVTAPVMISGLAEDPKSRQFEKSERYKLANRNAFAPAPESRASRARRARSRASTGALFVFQSKIRDYSRFVTYSHCQTTYRRPTDDRQSRVRGRTRRRARAGRCAMGPMCPSAPRAIAARAPRGRRVSRSRSGTGGASRRSRVVTTRSQAHNAMPSTPCRQRAEHKTINYRLI